MSTEILSAALPGVESARINRMTLKTAWKYRRCIWKYRGLWKYRKYWKYRKGVAAGAALLVGFGAARLTQKCRTA